MKTFERFHGYDRRVAEASEGVVTVRCPTTGRHVSTGVVIGAEAFEIVSFEGLRFCCDACSEIHGWEKKDATFRPFQGLGISRPTWPAH